VVVVVVLVVILWNTKIFGNFEAATWRQKALLSCCALIS
jgi:hypothetical protein